MTQITRCDVSLTASSIPADLSQRVVVVIDVLRATTTIAYALANGAHSIIPCEEPADAIAVRERFGSDRVLLGGERDCVRIPGFDIDNSPLSCVSETVRSKILAITTTNGTRALRRAMQGAARAVFCCAFTNLDAVVERLRSSSGANVLLACAGDEGEIALEDLLLAGAVAERLGASENSDAAKAAMLAYRAAAADLEGAIASSEHARALVRAGFARDIDAAARVNAASVVPMLENGELVASTLQ